MAPLSHDIAGVILPHNVFGTQLDGNGKTVDEDLEKQNFQHVSELLGEIWSNTVIDGHAVDARAVPLGQHMLAETPDPSM